MGTFFTSRWFNPKYMFKVHMGQFVLVAVIVALAVAKIVTRPSNMPMNRMDIVGVTMVSSTCSPFKRITIGLTFCALGTENSSCALLPASDRTCFGAEEMGQPEGICNPQQPRGCVLGRSNWGNLLWHFNDLRRHQLLLRLAYSPGGLRHGVRLTTRPLPQLLCSDACLKFAACQYQTDSNVVLLVLCASGLLWFRGLKSDTPRPMAPSLARLYHSLMHIERPILRFPTSRG
jgi:hypothetical protein